jgi:antitoxin ParD1/3/4
MSKITISMPEAMSDYVSHRVEEGQYGNVSEFFRDLVRQDQRRNGLSLDALRDRLRAGYESGVSDRTIEDIMEDVKARLRADGRL